MSTTMTIAMTAQPSVLGMPARVRAFSPNGQDARIAVDGDTRLGTSAWRPPMC